MSWSVNAAGKPADVKTELTKQFSYPLAGGSAGLSDMGERATVALVFSAIEQCLSTFDPEKEVTVTAFGHMSYADYEKKTGAYQNVNLTISPK
jgi:hypothetical protein